MKWLKEVERLSLSQLEEPQRRWADLDTALAEPVYNVATGLFLRDLLQYQQRRSKLGYALSGRAAL